MRPLPTSPTNTFQSPKVATRDGLEAASLATGLGAALAAGLAACLALVAAAAGGQRAAETAAAANPIARDETTRRVIKSKSFEPGFEALWASARAISLPSDRGEIPASRLADRRADCNPAIGYGKMR